MKKFLTAKFLTAKFFAAFLALGALAFTLFGCVQSPATVRALPTPAAASVTHEAEMNPAAVITAYYAALNTGNMETALHFLPDDVVFYTLEPRASGGTGRVEYKGIEAVQDFVKGDQIVFLRRIDEVTVNGDTVEYTLREWLNPQKSHRSVNVPVIVHYTATVRAGKILSITQNDHPFRPLVTS